MCGALHNEDFSRVSSCSIARDGKDKHVESLALVAEVMKSDGKSALRAVILGCTLKSSPKESSSELLGRQTLDALAEHGVAGEFIRVVDHGVKFGVSTDEGGGDSWPAIRAKILEAHILVIATPIWMGQ